MMKKKNITAEEFDRMFDEGEDVSSYVNWESARRPGLESKRVSVDFPSWMVSDLDNVSKKLGVTRQSVIKFFIADRLKQEKADG